jgi:ribose/xylose/arabinose/galactoside ABC-type transport system permease subunit
VTEAAAKDPVQRRLRLPRSQVPEYAGLVVLIVALCLFFAASEPLFTSGVNVQNLLRQGAVLAMLAAGQTFVILAGGIDISVGAQVSLLSVLAVTFSEIMPLPSAVALTIAAGCAIGAINGALVVFARISPIITTIGMWQLLVGATLWATDGLPQRSFDSDYGWLGRSEILFIATPTLLALLVILAAWFVLRRTRFGRYTYAVGGNLEAARLSGINVRLTLVGTYVLCSFFTALGALTLSSRVSAGLPDLGHGLEITAIAAVFIGGVAWGGGAGSVIGVILGVFLLTVIGNGLDLHGANSNLQTVITGLLIILAVGLNSLRMRSRRA